jgi:hypothetical protein
MIAALDALLAQAEYKVEANVSYVALRERAEAAEAERDAAVLRLETYESAHLAEARANDELRADRDKLLKVADQRLTEGLRMRAERDQARDALRRGVTVATQYMDTGRGDLDGWIDIARAALDATTGKEPT